jgi:acyl carrier protein
VAQEIGGQVDYNEREVAMSASNVTRDRVIKVIYSAFGLINSEKGSEGKLIESEETILFGHGANLDSFDLVGLVLSVESKVAQEFGVAVTLADEKAMSQRSSPFRTVATMADYIAQVIEEGKRG